MAGAEKSRAKVVCDGEWQGLIKHSILAQGEGLAVMLPEGFEKGNDLTLFTFFKNLLPAR